LIERLRRKRRGDQGWFGSDVFRSFDVARNQMSNLLRVGRDHEMRGGFDGRKVRPGKKCAQELVGALDGGMACAAAQHERGNVDSSERGRVRGEIISARPI
jgi:hypothetical protein